MYYHALALLFRCGLKSENHTATLLLLKELFEIDTGDIENAKKERVDKQYYVDFKATSDDVKQGIEIAEEFNANIREAIDRISTEKVNEIRETFEKI